MITSKNVGANTVTLSGAAAADLGIHSGCNNGTAAATLTANHVAGQITAQAGTWLVLVERTIVFLSSAAAAGWKTADHKRRWSAPRGHRRA